MKDPLRFTDGDTDPDNDVPHVSFSSDGRGRWHRREWKRQCPEGVFMHGRCQGVEGHKGVHWRYDASGAFCYDDNKADSSEHGGCGSVPPGHRHYHKPEDMAEHFYMRHSAGEDVTDPGEVARLEAGEVRPGESVNRPFKPSEVDPEFAEEMKRRLAERRSQGTGAPKVEGSVRKRTWWSWLRRFRT